MALFKNIVSGINKAVNKAGSIINKVVDPILSKGKETLESTAKKTYTTLNPVVEPAVDAVKQATENASKYLAGAGSAFSSNPVNSPSQGALRFVFTFIIPSLLIGTLPVEIVRNISFEMTLLVVVLALIWFTVSIYLFNWGVRKYESANLPTFGG